MASPFGEGYRRGYETQVNNPFAALIEQAGKHYERKIIEHEEDKKAMRALERFGKEQAIKFDYEQKEAAHAFERSSRLEEIKGKEQRETEKMKLAAETESEKSNLDILNSIFSGGAGDRGGKNFPPGTTATIKAGNTSLNVPVNREYTEGEAQILNYADTLSDDIEEMLGVLEDPKAEEAQLKSMIPSIFGLTPEAGGSEIGQGFKLLNQRIGQSILYMKTGKQINEQEYKRFKDMLPKFSRKDTLDIENMKKFKAEMDRISGRIQSGAKWDEKKKDFIGGETSEDTNKNKGSTPSGNKFRKIK